MSSELSGGVTTSLLAAAHEVVDDLLAAEMDLWSTEELLDNWREHERLRNRQAAVDQRFTAQVDARHLPSELGAKNTAAI